MSYFPSDIPYMTDNELEEHGINAKRERVMSEHISEAIDKTVHDKVVQNKKKFRANIGEANVELTRLGNALLDYIEKQMADSYQRGIEYGRNETWEAARKIALYRDEGGTSILDLTEIFDCCTIQQVFRRHTVSEAIAKLKAYEEKQKADDEIKVGDERMKAKIVKNEDCAFLYWTCSNCNSLVLEHDNFCSNCGADFRRREGEEKDNDGD